MSFGIPAFFVPRVPPPFFAADNTPGALSIYDTSPLNRTLEELVDFNLINSRKVRLSLGAVKVLDGGSVLFQQPHQHHSTDDVRASGSLPPGFPPVTIDGETTGTAASLPIHRSPMWRRRDLERVCLSLR